MDTWSQKRYTWFHWPRHAPRASLQCVYLSTNGHTKFIDKHTSCCTRHWNLNQKTSPNSLMSLWQRDNKHSWHMGCRPFTLRWSLQSCLSSALFIHRSVEAKKVHDCHYWQDTGITKMWCTEKHLWFLVTDNMPKMFHVQTRQKRQRSFCSCCSADLFPWASVNRLVINLTANPPSHLLFMSFFVANVMIPSLWQTKI